MKNYLVLLAFRNENLDGNIKVHDVIYHFLINSLSNLFCFHNKIIIIRDEKNFELTFCDIASKRKISKHQKPDEAKNQSIAPA